MLVGAFDPSAWAGLVFCNGPGRGFAFRFAIECEGQRFDGYDLLDIADKIGPHAPDASYARMSFTNMSLEWSRANKTGCVGRVQMNVQGFLEFRAYYPWDWSGSWSHSAQAGDAPHTEYAVRGKTQSHDEELIVMLRHTSSNEASIADPTFVVENGEFVVRCPMSSSDTLHFTSSMSTDGEKADQTALGNLDVHEVDGVLAAAAADYEAKRVSVDRFWDGLGASITNNLHWMTALQPESFQRYTPAGRRWIFPRHDGGKDHWTIFCWDAFFNALELSIESPELAHDALRSVLATQYANGNIPNWRGRFFGTPDRSQPPIGSFVALKMFLRTGDRAMLEEALPHLEKWSAWWRTPKGAGVRRDGNGNGLFEWGCDLDLLRHSPAPWENEASHHQFAAWESGQDDLPNWDDACWMKGTETLDLESVDLNSLIALDFDCLGAIAEALDLREKADEYRALYEVLSGKINDLLWDEDRGMYVDRFWDGRLSTRIAASNFYPLVAGIAPNDRAERMLTTLLDEKKFWGQYVLPTISRDDEAFKDQQYWRGTIWPPTNYLVYQGLKRYGFDAPAADLAERSVDLFLGSWRRLQLCRENYDSRTGEGGGQKYQSWGPLFALMGVEEFIDVTPWDGLRIGTLTPPPDTTLRHIRICDHQWSVSLSQTGLTVSVDGDHLLTSTGPMVLRHLEFTDGGFRAATTSAEDVAVVVSLGTEKVQITVDRSTSICSGNDVQIPAGQHSVRIKPH